MLATHVKNANGSISERGRGSHMTTELFEHIVLDLGPMPVMEITDLL